MQIDNSFAVDAPIAQAWDILIDVPRIVPCMPGAEITEAIDARHFKGRAQVKVGPVALAFHGEATLDELDRSTFRARVKARGSDTKGRGGAEADLTFRLVAEGNATRVEISADVTLTGAVAQYGRAQGLIKEIAGQLTKQFADNLKIQMAAGRPAPGVAAPTEAIPTRPISGLGLLWQALKAMLARWLGR